MATAFSDASAARPPGLGKRVAARYLAAMKRRRMLLLLALTPSLALAQEDALSLDEVIESGQDWLSDNVDAGVLESLGELDEAQARKILGEIQKRFQGEYVINLAPLRGAADAAVKVLERFPATQPSADWLRPRLDYFEVAEELRVVVPPPEPKPGEAPPPPRNPTPEQERKAWREKLSERPMPRGAEPYVKKLKPVFTAQKMPPELVWIAEVESSFNPNARSPVGAAGLFQIMPATARSLGLSLSPSDERLDPEKSAAAAGKYLRALHRRFKDWPLVCAAYNCGEGRLQTLLTKHGAKTFDQVATRLPAETQMYVPKINAVLLRREGKTLASLEAPV
jgi:membrane-bound lytic murein transglycosylase D